MINTSRYYIVYTLIYTLLYINFIIVIYKLISVHLIFFFFFYLKITNYIDESKHCIVNSQPRLPFLKPKSSTGSAFSSVVVSKPTTASPGKCATICAQEMCRSVNQCKQMLSNSISTQILIESSKREHSESQIQKYYELENTNAEVPREIRSLLPPNNNIRAISPTHLVVFPPEIPLEYRIHSRSRTSTPQPMTKPQVIFETEPQCAVISTKNIVVDNVESIVSQSIVECSEVVESFHVENQSQEKYEESRSETYNFVQDQPIHDNNIINMVSETKSKLTKPTSITHEVIDGRVESPMVAALKTAPERSYSPLPSYVDASEFVSEPVTDPVEDKKPMTMSDALTVAPDRSYKLPEPKLPTRPIGNNPVRYMHGYNKRTPAAPLLMTRSLIYSPMSTVDSEEEQIAILGLKSFPPVSDELKLSTAAGDFDRNEPDNFEYVDELVFDIPSGIDTSEEPTVDDENDTTEPPKFVLKYPFTASGLHEPLDIPRYQQSIPENPHRVTPSDKPTVSSAKLIGPGIKDKVSTFTPKPSIKNATFLKQESSIHAKVAPALGYEPSPLEGSPSKSKNADPCDVEIKSTDSEPAISTIGHSLKSIPTLPIPVTLSSNPSVVTPIIKPQNYTSINHDLAGPVVAPMPKTSLPAALLSKKLTCLTKKLQPKCIPTPLPVPNLGGQPTGRAGGASAGLTVPRRGRGVLNPQNLTPGARVPLCGQCNLYIR